MRRFDASNILVFEDTVPSIESAKKAGATVFSLGFDAQNYYLFRNAQLEYPPDIVTTDYAEAANLLHMEK